MGKILVTGAGGFVGAAVIAAGEAAGHEMIGTIRPGGNPGRLAGRSASLVPLDLKDRAGVADTLAAHRPDIIVHAAWSGVSNAARHERRQITDNLETSLGLVEAAVAAGVRKFVGLGSQGEYGRLSGKISEDALPEPTSLYGAAKLAALCLTRQLCFDGGVDFAWVRLFSTYGPADNPHWLIPSLITAMLKGERPKTTEGRQLWDYLYIDDVGSAILAIAMAQEAAGLFNLGSGRPVPVRAIVEAIRDRAAPGLELVFGEIPYRADQIWHMQADITRLMDLTGFVPEIGLEEGLDRTVAWHRAQLGTSS